MRLEIFGIDGERLLEAGDRFVEPPLEEVDAADLIEHDAVARVLLGGDRQMLERLVVPAERLQGRAEEEVRLRQTRRQFQRLLEHRDRGVDVAFLERARATLTGPSAYAGSMAMTFVNAACAAFRSPCSSRPIP